MNKKSCSNICKRYGTSRKTYYKWNNRYKQKGIEGLLDASKRPHNETTINIIIMNVKCMISLVAQHHCIISTSIITLKTYLMVTDVTLDAIVFCIWLLVLIKQ